MINFSETRVILPYGTTDVDPELRTAPGNAGLIRCYIRDCNHFLRIPGRGIKGDICPVHRIRCHSSSAGATYSYAEPTRNIIASPKLFGQKIIGHPFKYESHRLGLERSEDALSWNVFRSLQEAGRLNQIAELVTGESCGLEPFLYLWGICISHDEFQPWDLLIAARKRFESNLPVERPLTEPDIALHLPGKYLILIEAKFTSPNTFYKMGPRKDSSSLTLQELLGIYHDPSLKILDQRKARESEHVYYQLWRNTVFAEWMASLDHPQTKAFHVNLVREASESKSDQEFHRLIQPDFKERFSRMTWEDIHRLLKSDSQVTYLLEYLKTKTAGLAKAFQIN